MGNEMSEERVQEELDRFMKNIDEDYSNQFNIKKCKEAPDLRVNKNIVKFCSLSSSDNLKQHYEQRRMKTGDRAADWMKSLVEKLGALTPAPAQAGLVTLAIAVLIDIISLSPPEESIKEALQSVFAEQKASEVWDQIDECLKRCIMHINNHEELKSDIKRIEIQLSTALTKLKNSMMRDGQMSSPALKAWVNGAAFHIQMLIHLVRLGGAESRETVRNLLSVYETDLDQLFDKHKEMIKSKCCFRREVLEDCGPISYLVYLVDEELAWHRMYIDSHYDRHFEAYYNHKYMRQKPDIQQHFKNVRRNLQSLVHSTGVFRVQ